MRRRPPIPPAPPPPGSAARDVANARGILRGFEPALSATKPVRPSPLTTFNGIPLELLDLLRDFPLFTSAPDQFLVAISNHLHLKAYKPRDSIITEGDEAKSMFWLVRGNVAVTSRDGESTYAELRRGAFFGEIGVLMDIPRTASIVARTHCVVAHLTKESLRAELPNYPSVERAIREEAEERLALLRKKKSERPMSSSVVAGVKRRSEELSDRDSQGLKRQLSSDQKNGDDTLVVAPGGQWVSNSVLSSGLVNIRQLLKELPLFASLPAEILHFLGLSAQPKTYGPFSVVIKQHTAGGSIYFIVRGEVEVVDESDPKKPNVKARLGKGKFFGEVTALSLAPLTTATVRSVSQCEFLVIGGDALAELWRKCPKEIQQQVEKTARSRLADTEMMDVSDSNDDLPLLDPLQLHSNPKLTISGPDQAMPAKPPNDPNPIEPFDPDPLFRVDFENMKARSRRSSLAPPTTSNPSSPSDENKSPFRSNPGSPSRHKHISTPPEFLNPFKKPRTQSKIASLPKVTRFNTGQFSDDLVIAICKNLELHELMRMRLVCSHWRRLLTNSQQLMKVLDLRPYNRILTDTALIDIARFVGQRPEYVDLSNCFHITDHAFVFLAQNCAMKVKIWRMKSVWDITGQAILEMSNRAKNLERVDLSNCRKVSDQLLQRIVGWVVEYPLYQAGFHQGLQVNTANGEQANSPNAGRNASKYNPSQPPVMLPPPGTVVGCPGLKHLTLSYCKHVTDRTMLHLAQHASKRLESIDLTRCTTITDQGFHSWSIYRFDKLKSLCLADCTYLTDGAVVYLTNAAKHLEVLDLSFCCALSDTATEVISLGCPNLTSLNLSFCGSAVSDSSLRAIGLHLLELERLSVRGCVRVTEVGVDAVVEGCRKINFFDVSQCRNLSTWVETDGVERCQKRFRRKVRFLTVAADSDAAMRDASAERDRASIQQIRS